MERIVSKVQTELECEARSATLVGMIGVARPPQPFDGLLALFLWLFTRGPGAFHEPYPRSLHRRSRSIETDAHSEHPLSPRAGRSHTTSNRRVAPPTNNPALTAWAANGDRLAMSSR